MGSKRTTYDLRRKREYQVEFADWLLMDRGEKLRQGIVTTEQEFGAARGITNRTLYNWKNDPDFLELVEERRVARVAALVPNVVTMDKKNRQRLGLESAAPDPTDAARESEEQYHRLRQLLYEQAARGDAKSIDLWFRLYGKPFVEAENASAMGDLARMSDDDLLANIVQMLPSPSITELFKRLDYEVLTEAATDAGYVVTVAS